MKILRGRGNAENTSEGEEGPGGIAKVTEIQSEYNGASAIEAWIRESGKDVAGSNAALIDRESGKFENVVAHNKNTSQSAATRGRYPNMHDMDRVERVA